MTADSQPDRAGPVCLWRWGDAAVRLLEGDPVVGGGEGLCQPRHPPGESRYPCAQSFSHAAALHVMQLPLMRMHAGHPAASGACAWLFGSVRCFWALGASVN